MDSIFLLRDNGLAFLGSSLKREKILMKKSGFYDLLS